MPGSPDDTDVVTSDEQETVVLAYVLRVDVPDRPDETDVVDGRLADLLRLTHDLEALLLSGRVKGSDHERQVRGDISGVRRKTADLDDCSLEDEVEIVESILAELQIYIASPCACQLYDNTVISLFRS